MPRVGIDALQVCDTLKTCSSRRRLKRVAVGLVSWLALWMLTGLTAPGGEGLTLFYRPESWPQPMLLVGFLMHRGEAAGPRSLISSRPAHEAVRGRAEVRRVTVAFRSVWRSGDRVCVNAVGIATLTKRTPNMD